MKAIRYGGYFQEWRPWHAIDPVKDLSIDEALKLYGLGAQANYGDNNTPLPSIMDIQERVKWNAWSYFRGKSRR